MKCRGCLQVRPTKNQITYVSADLNSKFLAGIKIIKSLLPPKAVSSMKFVDSKNIREYISTDCMLTSWGGTDDYAFQFEPENAVSTPELNKQVCFNSEKFATCFFQFWINLE